MPAPCAAFREPARWIGPVLLGSTGLASVAWTWGTWPDPIIDFGRELYAPWQLAEGAVLYRDVAWFNGPLSPSFNALCFALFGPGLLTLVGVNLALLALLTGLLYRHLTALAGRFAATVACLFFLIVLAFGQQLAVGNFNWLCPYSHEATHGVLLAVGALAALRAWGSRGGLAPLAVAGGLLGLSFLTKPEVFLAAAASSGVAFALHHRRTPSTGRRSVPLSLALGLFLGAALLPGLTAFAALASAIPAAEALRGVSGGWPTVAGGELTELAFYRAGLGFDRPSVRLYEIAAWAGAALAVFIPAFALARLMRGDTARSRVVATLTFAIVGIVVWLAGAEADWLAAARPLPLFAFAVGAVWLAVLLRGGRREDPRAVDALAWSVLAVALLLKMILNARLSHYGFALAMPAAVLLAATLTGWVPAFLARRGAASSVFAAAAVAVLAIACTHYVRRHAGYLEWKRHPVGTGADAFLADSRGIYMTPLLRLVQLEAGPTGTAIVLPEGVMINYLARRRNPTPYVNFMPPELAIFGEETMLAALRANPPDVVVLVHRHTREYGFPFFGRDYGRSLLDWVRAHYRTIRLFGEPPLRPGTTFGIEVLVPSS